MQTTKLELKEVTINGEPRYLVIRTTDTTFFGILFDRSQDYLCVEVPNAYFTNSRLTNVVTYCLFKSKDKAEARLKQEQELINLAKALKRRIYG